MLPRMALPVAPPPKSNDVAILGWAGLTVRVAWTLLVSGVKVRPDVLRDARIHVLYHLDAAIPLPHAEDLATRLVEEFVARARGQAPNDPWSADWEMPLSPRWRRALDKSLDAVSEAVFRKHYGDDRGLALLEEALQVDRIALEAVQSGLREVVRRIAVADGLPLDGWPPERIDRLLRRIAAHAPGPCPPVLDVAEGCHREHVVTCPRCDRMTRLLRSSVLEVDDLFPPTVGARPAGRARVLAIHLHPDARRTRRRLVDELPVDAFSIGDDLLLIDGSQIEAVAPVLRMAAEVELPPREHLRGVVLDGAGTWTPRGLVGPLADKAAREVLHRSWGAVDGIGELPPPLPPPPSARRWWAATAAVVLVGLVVLGLALTPPPPVGPASLDARFTPGRGGTWASFDVPEDSVVSLVAERDGALATLLVSKDAADKVVFATGDGGYRVHVQGDAVLVVATDAPLPDLAAQVRAAQATDAPIEHLAEQLAATSEVRWFRRQ